MTLLCALGAVGFASSSTAIPLSQYSSSSLTVAFLSVGHGDACWIRTPDDKNILIDGGLVEAGNYVISYLRDHGVSHLDVMVLTHPHPDHIGGLIAVADQMPVRSFYTNGDSAMSDASRQLYVQLTNSLAAQGVYPSYVRAGRQYNWSPYVTVRALHPSSPLMSGTSDDVNNNSIVLRISYGRVDFLLTGDIQQEAEARILNGGYPVDAEILKVAHHGINTSSSALFLAAVSPEVAVISLAMADPFGAAAPKVLARLQAVGAKVYRTDEMGTITIETDGQAYDVIPDHWPTPYPSVFHLYLPSIAGYSYAP